MAQAIRLWNKNKEEQERQAIETASGLSPIRLWNSGEPSGEPHILPEITRVGPTKEAAEWLGVTAIPHTGHVITGARDDTIPWPEGLTKEEATKRATPYDPLTQFDPWKTFKRGEVDLSEPSVVAENIANQIIRDIAFRTDLEPEVKTADLFLQGVAHGFFGENFMKARIDDNSYVPIPRPEEVRKYFIDLGVKSPEWEPEGYVSGQVTELAGEIGGSVASVMLGFKVARAVGVQAPSSLIQKHPYLARFLESGTIGASIEQIKNFEADGSLRENIADISKDFVSYGLFGVSALVPNSAWATWGGLGFSTGFLSAKMDGASDREAVVSGLITTATLGAMKAFGPTQMTKNSNQLLREQARATLKKYNYQLSENPTQKELTQARRSLAHIYHPDKWNSADPSGKTMAQINNAIKVLQTTPEATEYRITDWIRQRWRTATSTKTTALVNVPGKAVPLVTPKGYQQMEKVALSAMDTQKPATKEQVSYGYILAKERGLIGSDKKPLPEYRQKAMEATGKASIEDMTQAEATKFISALKRDVGPAESIKIGMGVKPEQIKASAGALAQYVRGERMPEKLVPITKTSAQKGWLKETKEKLQGFANRTYRVERMLNALDNYKDGGPMWSTFYEPALRARQAQVRNTLATEDQFREIYKRAGIDLKELLSKKTEVAPGIELTGSERIGVYLHSLNPDNTYHVVHGNMLPENVIEEVSAGLSPQERQLADFIHDRLQEETPLVNRTRELVEGVSIVKVEDYFPIKFVGDPYIEAKDIFKADDNARRVAKMVTRGFVQERVPGASQPVDLDAVSVFFRHMDAVEHYKAFAPIMKDLGAIMKQPELREAISARAGKEAPKVFDQWLKQMAMTNPLAPANAGEAAMRTLRVNATAGALGLNIVSSLRQFGSFMTGVAEVGTVPAIKGLMTYLSHPKQVSAEIKKYAPDVYRRSVEREVEEVRIMKNVEKRIGQKLAPQEVLFFLLTTIDRATVNSIWKGGFDKFLKKQPGEIQKAADEASAVIRKTQPYFDIKDIPEYYRSGEFMKALTMFTNQLNQNWNYYRHDIAGKRMAHEISNLEVMRKIMWAFIGPALFMGWAARSRPAKTTKEVGQDMLLQGVASIPIMGTWMTSGLRGFQSGGTISTEVLNQITKFWNAATNSNWEAMGKSGLRAMGYGLGVPVTAGMRFWDGILSLADGNLEDWKKFIWGEYLIEQRKREDRTKTISPHQIPRP